MKLLVPLSFVIGVNVSLAYFLCINPEDFNDPPFVSIQAVRSAGFFGLGVNCMLCVFLLATWISNNDAKNKLRHFTDDGPISLKHEPTTAIRAGFTLIELLVTIGIIGILAALLLTGVVVVLRKGPEVRNRNDIFQLGVGLENFRTKYGFYPPSKIRLCPKLSGYKGSTLDQQSLAYINSVWPSIQWIDPKTQLENTFNWDGSAAMPLAGESLEGHQCLVFFLGGIPRGNNKAPDGFWNNPINPTVKPNSGEKAKFFDFESARCEILVATMFPSYLDSHYTNHGKKTPFAYFCSWKRPDGYAVADNASLAVAPYMESATKYFSSTKYQLLSAGPDGVFGVGGMVTPGTAVTGSGKDDIANFYDKNLGN